MSRGESLGGRLIEGVVVGSVGDIISFKRGWG